MRVCAYKQHKPTLQEAIKAFTVVKKSEPGNATSNDLPSAQDPAPEFSLRDTFISRPLIGLLEERLIPVLRYRGLGMDWRGADNYFIEVVAGGNAGTEGVPDKHFEPEDVNPNLPSIVTEDHLASHAVSQYSFPLIAMQYTLRHFVRCTEFCLVCHRQLDTEVEAIKPYVCDDQLCLFQYINLGFGPSFEHEIMAQPYVVDLLISFCYSSAAARKLKDYPSGLGLMVPPIESGALAAATVPGMYASVAPQPSAVPALQALPILPVYEVGFDRERQEIIFHVVPEKCPVKAGSWIVLKTKGTLEGSDLHCRVSETTYYLTIRIDQPVMLRTNNRSIDESTVPSAPPKPKSITPVSTPKWVASSFQVYEQDFEQLDDASKCLAIGKLLDTLPNVKQMQEYLVRRRPALLSHWVERISPAALSLLRWIIASNRACIMQVDGDGETLSKPQERLSGMQDYVQFRFAMGAPDKEQRFLSSVHQTEDRLQLKHPTMFAWHGSPLYNWHMIIREGLHFKNTDHGRAYGHGVYHAKDAQISTGYSGYGHYAPGTTGNIPGQWPNSTLRISTALALNEIVNAPAEFVSSSPYYVVQHLDWIQTRYLFVKCSPVFEKMLPGKDIIPANAHVQDPTRTPQGVSGSVVIPASAIKSGRKSASRPKGHARPSSHPSKKQKTSYGHPADPITIDSDDDADSAATDEDDRDIMYGEDTEPEASKAEELPHKRAELEQPYSLVGTDFVPGKLDWDTLPLMPLPEYATSGTTKILMREISLLQKTQKTTPLASLGWYVDAEKIENVYQWIVELHSFGNINAKLELVADMKKLSIPSIVLEIRFNKEFPISPPYVRVIRPRFLSLAQGGGGHIVMGGAMCMELLTNTGWSSVSTMESVLMCIRMAIASDPPAKLDKHAKGDYGIGEAADGYLRACASHGWTVPAGFKEMAYGAGGPSKGR